MRKTHYIRLINQRDIQAMQAMRCCGYMNRTQLKHFLTDSRIKAFCHEGVIERCLYQKGKEQIECYRFSRGGFQWCEKHMEEMNSRSLYRSASPLHDIAIANKYLSLSLDQRETWRTEQELRGQFEQMLDKLREEDFSRWVQLKDMWEQNQISVPDGAYQDGEHTVLYECITNNYSEADLQAKEEYSLAVNLEIQYQKI